MKKIFEKIFGTYSEREIKRIKPIVDKIESLEEEMKGLTDEQLKAKTDEFKNRLNNGETLDDILPEAFAVVREAADRVLGMRHYRVQLIGGVVLHQGRIAEMKTGEGKTLVATLPVYLNALTGKGVHVVTVNDYLAKRDKDWMGKVYRFLGLSVSCIVHGMDNKERREAYNCDITYGTNNEFGFDYLRDNMVIYKKEMVQRELNYAIIDEVDSILIDEARTPLIISGSGDKSTNLYHMADKFVRTLKGRKLDPNEKSNDLFSRVNREIKEEKVDFVVDEKGNNVTLTEKGVEKAENFFSLENLADPANMEISHHINQALKAHNLMKRDKDYIVKDGQVVIVDEFTGRLMFGRRYSDGLHQAIEAKEGLDVRRESKTLATITFQNYFRMYKKLAGMTGTAKTEEDEFREIYGMDVVEIPTNKPVIREDCPDVIYKTQEAKFKAIAEEIKEKNEHGQPVLVGTVSIEKSELLSRILKRAGIKHEVLNAKHHEKEAEIVAQAGRFKAVTIATNMAGRGTDIVLGGNPEFLAKNDMKKKGYSDEILAQVDSFNETDDPDILEARKVYNKLLEKSKKETKVEHEKVIQAGGLHIIGTERHESRRIDNQLRGRSGRQGDPGSSRFYISLEDDLMRLFGSDRIKGIVESLGMPDDEPLEHNLLTKSIETAQKRVEGRNFNIRKHVLQYDDVMNKQREVIYAERRKVLEGENLKDNILNMIENIIDNAINIYTGEIKYPEEWDIKGLEKYLSNIYLPEGALKIDDIESLTREDLKEKLLNVAKELYKQKEKEVGIEQLRELERIILLRVVDTKWMDHIDAMDQLRQGIGLRALGQEDPVRAYQVEGFDMFEEMIKNIQEETVKHIFHLQRAEKLERKRVAQIKTVNHGDKQPKQKTVVKGKKIGRNDPCPCGSGKKYKKCCGRNV
ncbi:preprotein translocase subunit SecA [Caldisalinibacter kiritimatiensis]|uniref:Protein translocase subunit SecA n=1 Tax=Caldisalinibacter kiritimatiensis TaxID=1304284 RepID=R1CNW9_9FIRM|nr:preprotein translocase subunit SecA [Caldisalinibacter kiritimatiensis]EOD00396.1 Protein export cytoplasm protein SecA ATPase RNA helicase [Caldisalinibacter kiritimatiensis]